MMLGDFVEMNDRLVRYRCGTGVSNAILEVRRPMLRLALDWLAAVEQGERDLGRVRDASVWRERLADARGQAEARRDLVGGGTWRVRLSGARRIRMSGRVWSFLKFAFVLPRPLGSPLLFVYAVVRYLRRRLSGLCTAKFKSC